MKMRVRPSSIVWRVGVAGAVVAFAFGGCGTVGEVGVAYTGDAGALGDEAKGPCDNLECQQVKCEPGKTTTISGTFVTGSKNHPDPIYGGVLYVPNRPVEPFPPGVACERCSGTLSGRPLVSGVTFTNGRFVITNVPAGDNIPLVVQVGRWRRQVVIPHVDACVDNPLPTELTRLPRNQTEGDIPLTAIVTGGVDPVECALRKMGIEDSEFTLPHQNGRIRVYRQDGANVFPDAPPGFALWGDPAELAKYDLVLLPCEGRDYPRPLEYQQNLIDYTGRGGRLFTSHYGYNWIRDAPDPFARTAIWNENDEVMGDPSLAFVDTTFPKGAAFAAWLLQVGASTDPGQLSITEARHNADATLNGSQRWIFTGQRIPSLQHYTFNTPVGVTPDKQCGRVVFSDFHVVTGESNTKVFPDECYGDELNAQGKVLEFMLFDVLSCVQAETGIPVPPTK